jgi:RecJ-like exonuclease
MLAGLTGFQLHLQQRDPAEVQIADIRPCMNFSVIAVQGRLVSEPLRLRSGSILYSVNDGTGTIAVFTEVPYDAGPARVGDRIRAVGHLSIGVGKNIRLQVRSAEGLVLQREPEAPELCGTTVLPDITAALQGACVTVTGCVWGVSMPAPGSRAPHRIILTDGITRLHTVNWLDQPPDVSPGEWVKVTGRVQVYKGRVELRLMDGTEISAVD